MDLGPGIRIIENVPVASRGPEADLRVQAAVPKGAVRVGEVTRGF